MSILEDVAAHVGVERSGAGLGPRLNWLRAGALGANDGIVSTAGIVVGVAGAAATSHQILVAGVAGMVAGALSMGGGEYMSVSTQKDTEVAVLVRQRRELAEMPDEELAELAAIYEGKGLSPTLARSVAEELTAHDALAAHAEAELGISATERTSPWQAAWASMLAFTLGAILPLLAMVFSAPQSRMIVTWAAVLAALALTGVVTARLGGSGALRPIGRNLAVGTLTMGLTYAVGSLVAL